MVEVLRTTSLSDAYAVQMALQAAGITAALQGEHSLGTVAGHLAIVVLDEAEADAARAVVADTLRPSARPS